MRKSTDPKQFKIALEKFGDYLSSPKTKESDWQSLFFEFPFILTETLPIKISNLYEQIDIESGNPDFAFFETTDEKIDSGYFGIIELKRHNDKLIRIYSSKHISPSYKLGQARSQVEHYLEEIKNSQRIKKQYSLSITHSNYSFIIMGCSKEILKKCNTEIYKKQFSKILPDGLSIVPYDSLFKSLKKKSENLLIMDVMLPIANNYFGFNEPKKYKLILSDDFGYHDENTTHLMTTSGLIPIPSGKYKQVFGIPRKIWPLSKERMFDSYYCEMEKKLGEIKFKEYLRVTKGKFPLEAFEVSGEFDSDSGKWTNSSNWKLFIPGEGIHEAINDEWLFSFYEGDKLYYENGEPYIISKFNLIV